MEKTVVIDKKAFDQAYCVRDTKVVKWARDIDSFRNNHNGLSLVVFIFSFCFIAVGGWVLLGAIPTVLTLFCIANSYALPSVGGYEKLAKLFVEPVFRKHRRKKVLRKANQPVLIGTGQKTVFPNFTVGFDEKLEWANGKQVRVVLKAQIYAFDNKLGWHEHCQQNKKVNIDKSCPEWQENVIEQKLRFKQSVENLVEDLEESCSNQKVAREQGKEEAAEVLEVLKGI